MSINRYRLCVFCLFFICLCGVTFVAAQENKQLLKGKIIYLDPGHGGADPGALYKDIEEQRINLIISKKTMEKLESMGASVYLTRYGNYDLSVPYAVNRKRSDLSRRANIINRSNCDLYLSIHLNADNSSSWHGAEAYYDDVNPENKKIAEIMQKQFKKYLNSSREYKKTDTMYLHKRISRPGGLLEVGFLSNPNERYLLTRDSYQDKVATAITEGIIQYLVY